MYMIVLIVLCVILCDLSLHVLRCTVDITHSVYCICRTQCQQQQAACQQQLVSLRAQLSVSIQWKQGGYIACSISHLTSLTILLCWLFLLAILFLYGILILLYSFSCFSPPPPLSPLSLTHTHTHTSSLYAHSRLNKLSHSKQARIYIHLTLVHLRTEMERLEVNNNSTHCLIYLLVATNQIKDFNHNRNKIPSIYPSLQNKEKKVNIS